MIIPFVRITIAATSIDIPPTPSDLLRRQMADRLETLAKAVTLGNDATNLEQGGPQREQLTRIREALEQDRQLSPNAEQLKELSEAVRNMSQGIDAQLQSLVANAEQALAADTDLVNSDEVRDATALSSKLKQEILPAVAAEHQQLVPRDAIQDQPTTAPADQEQQPTCPPPDSSPR